MFGGSPRWLIGLLMAFVLLAIIGNIIEGADVMTRQQVLIIQNMTDQQYIEVKEPDVGGTIAYESNPFSIYDAVRSAITRDWTWLYDIDTTYTTEATCEAADGHWNDTDDLCMIPNEFYVIWAIVYWPIMAAILIEGAVALARLIRGGG